VLGVPFEVIPFEAPPRGSAPEFKPRYRIHAVPEKREYEITFPRVEGYTQKVSARIHVDWEHVAPLELDPAKIPAEVDMAIGLPNNKGRISVLDRNRVREATLGPYHAGRRIQALVFEMARDLTRDLVQRSSVSVPAGVLFPQIVKVVQRYVDDRVFVTPPNDRLDLGLSPYYGWAIERLHEAIHPAGDNGEGAELPEYERGRRRVGSTAEVDAWTSKPVREVGKCHLNFCVADTANWEQAVAARLDKSPLVRAFVKNEFLGFAIPYIHDGQDHEYYPDFLVRLREDPSFTLILEVKGRPDPLEQVKAQAAQRWVSAVNAEASFGEWGYAIVRDPARTVETLEAWLR
jgi:type III restriction enzyme